MLEKSSVSTIGSNQPAQRASLILTIWAEGQPSRPPVWRGYVETPGGQRIYFDTLPALASLLHELGWRDPGPKLTETL